MNLAIQEVSIIIAAKGLSPSMLNPDFLKYSDIVPSDWKYRQKPIFTSTSAQILYESGIRISSQPNRVAFAQEFTSQEQPSVLINDMATKFVEKLPNADYLAVGVNPRGVAPFLGNEQGAHNFLFIKLFAQGSWQKVGQSPPQAAFQVTYFLEKGQLNLAVNAGNLKVQDGNNGSALIFSGNFNYPVQGAIGRERVQNVQDSIQLWQSTMVTFQKLINEHFLSLVDQGQSEQGIPEAPPMQDEGMVL